MKLHLNRIVVVAAFVASPAFATPDFVVDFEKTWDFANGSVDGYYGGGTAADGTSGPDVGVTFIDVSGLSNDVLGPYFANAPSPLGVMYVYDPAAVMNVAAGVNGHLSFSYSSSEAVPGAILAYSGLNGTGSLLGSFDLAANSSADNDSWTRMIIEYSGIAESFQLGGSASKDVVFDNISTAPEPGTYALMLASFGLLGLARRGKQKTT